MRTWLGQLARFGLWLALLLAQATLQAQPVQPVPALTARVVDTTGTLDAGQQAQLEQALARIEQERGAQVVVLLVATTAPEDIASYANRVANAWKIGRRDIGDGVLLLVAKNDRRLRIEVAKALEGAIPDLAARQIIDEAITPRLRQNDYAGALLAGVAQLDARIRGENLPAPAPAAQDGLDEDTVAPLLFVLFIAVPVVAGVLRSVLGRRLGAAATGVGVGVFAALVLQTALWLAAAAGLLASVIALVAGLGPLLRSGAPSRRGRIGPGPGGWAGGAGGFGGGWSGGGGGGGFSSGGGGDFGGGGASGDW
nr:TPM domain-containing protein [Variovorax boronicumulans]